MTSALNSSYILAHTGSCFDILSIFVQQHLRMQGIMPQWWIGFPLVASCTHFCQIPVWQSISKTETIDVPGSKEKKKKKTKVDFS